MTAATVAIHTPVLIVGGGTGGVAAALAVAARGIACIMTEPTDWVGGQLTSQAVPPDENQWIEGTDGVQSATHSYLDYRNRVRQWYRQNRKLSADAMGNARLNPGNGWVSHLCHEPIVGHAVLREMLAPHIASGLVKIFLDTEPTAVDVNGDQIRTVTFRNTSDGTTSSISADYVLDATELGDILKLGGVEYHAGAEHTTVHGELHGRPDKTNIHDIQAISWCFALEHRPGENHTITRPDNYAFWRDWVPPLTPPWSGRLLSWTTDNPPRTFRWLPWPQEPKTNEWEMWRYRRIVDRSLYAPAAQMHHPDVALVNMVQMDYFLKPTLEVTATERLAAFSGARELSLSFLYWMQTDAPRFDGTSGTGYPGLRLHGDELGTADGFAKFPYIREARRLDAMTMVTERHVGMEQRRAEKLLPPDAPQWGIADCFADSVGIGHYRLDLHPSTAMRNSLYVEAAPFRIPLGALVPKRVTNLLAAGKCLGVTHITNGCYRLHPVEWNIGQSAGQTAAFCIARNLTPHQILAQRPRLRELQHELTTTGVPLSWPWENAAGLS